jgi:hypothetical protein
MKKILVVAIGRLFSSRSTRSALLPVLALGLGLVFSTATATPPTARATPEEGHQPGRNKCEVCHNPRNYHTIRIPCDKVDKYLKNHPGDFRGACEVTPVTNS